MAEVTIEATPNGPYLVTGIIELRDTNGNVLPTRGKVWLCRCGASTKKPFCDGTHSNIGFQAADRCRFHRCNPTHKANSIGAK
jgi:3-phenylpropionate/trans-cinnamate dioxygenase ferredoxin subunit